MISVNLKLVGETKNKFRYAEDSELPQEHCGDLYIQKRCYPNGAPALLNISIRELTRA